MMVVMNVRIVTPVMVMVPVAADVVMAFPVRSGMLAGMVAGPLDGSVSVKLRRGMDHMVQLPDG